MKEDNTAADPFDLEELVTFRLSRLADTLARAAAQAYGRQFDLSLTEWRILAILRRHQPMTANEISRRSRIDKAWISRSIASLGERDLLTKSANPRDARSLLLSLTAAGRRLVDEVAPLSRERHKRLLAGLSPRQRDVFLHMLASVEVQADGLLGD